MLGLALALLSQAWAALPRGVISEWCFHAVSADARASAWLHQAGLSRHGSAPQSTDPAPLPASPRSPGTDCASCPACAVPGGSAALPPAVGQALSLPLPLATAARLSQVAAPLPASGQRQRPGLPRAPPSRHTA
ncbi:MAG: hypothetical protein RL722_1948 [Pseudomonadota bacterium]|jgi:hypothetical protein